MAGEIFISYRRADEAWARLLHSQLQAEGVEAWYDAQVGAGQDWRISTAKALETSQIFVLLFSANAAQSSDIAKELAAATLEKKLIIPVRLENIAPKGAFLYELASRNWVNAFENTEAKLAELAKGLAHLVRTGARDESVLPFDRTSGGGKTSFRRGLPRPAIITTTVAVIAASAVAAWLYAFVRPSVQVVVKAAPVAVASERSAGPTGISIAVLPFLNLSSDKEQDFFSDGITEEITSALAKVSGLRVIGRTSAFQFKSQNRDLRAIGRALGAKDLIEGSVRKDGNQLRITAQLIRADDGTHLWTESYDRELNGIFAIQEEIATAIADAMKVPLGLKQGQNLVSNRTDDLDAYQQYLHARALFRAAKAAEAISTLKLVVVRVPNYAPAWALLANAYLNGTNFGALGNTIRAGRIEEARHLAESVLDHAEKAAREAIRLDPRLALGYAALANIENIRRRLVASEDNWLRAMALDPNDPDVLSGYADFLTTVGRIQEARRIHIQILAQEPAAPEYSRQAANGLWAIGQNNAAIKMFEAMSPGQVRNGDLAKAYATAGRYAEAADTLLAIPELDQSFRQSRDAAARLIRSAPAKVAAPDPLPNLAPFSFVYLFIGAEGQFLESGERALQINLNLGQRRTWWGPPSASMRKTERFKAYVRNIGLVDYWRVRGWPNACHPVGADDFACE